MLKLIRLEWGKNQIGKYVRNAAILTATLLILIIAMASELNADTTIPLYGKSMVNVSVELFTHMSYIVFTGVMLSAFIVSAYEKKTINLMFSYPIRRQKILLSKIISIWIFNFFALIMSKLLIYIALLLTQSFTHISTTSIQIGDLSFWLNIIFSSSVMISISHISLLVGLKMKSTKATIVTSIIVVLFTQGNIGTYTLINSVPFYTILFILSFVSVFLSIYNVETKDVM